MADNLLKKSDENIKAAEKLIQQKMPNTSIHCSYYACYQILKYILFTQYNFTDEKLRAKLYEIQKAYINNNNNDKLDSHKAFVDCCLEVFENKVENGIIGKLQLLSIRNEMQILREKRNEADYKNIDLCDDNIAKSVKNKAVLLVTSLKNLI